MPRLPKKGDCARIVKGDYMDRNAWFDVNNKKTKSKVYVIIEEHNGEEIHALLAKDSVIKKEAPECVGDAGLQQHPKIYRDMILLAKKLARFKLDTMNQQWITLHFGELLEDATEQHIKNKGPRLDIIYPKEATSLNTMDV